MKKEMSEFVTTKEDVDWALSMFYYNDYLIQKEGIINNYPHITTHRQWVKEFGEHK